MRGCVLNSRQKNQKPGINGPHKVDNHTIKYLIRFLIILTNCWVVPMRLVPTAPNRGRDSLTEKEQRERLKSHGHGDDCISTYNQLKKN